MFRALLFGVSINLVLVDISFSFILRSSVVQEKTDGICPASIAEVRNNVSQLVQGVLQNLVAVPDCGPGNWVQVASLNVSDPQQNCPSPWVMETTPERSCVAASSSCASVYFDTLGVIYQNVCGMALGYGTGSLDAFRRFYNDDDIDSRYLEGVSITHGQPRQHIWSLAGGHGGTFRCPCDSTDRNFAVLPPSFVGNNYFCDGSYNGALWDGKDCTTDCCTFNNPPWFMTTLPAPTSDNIETRICHDEEPNNERIFVNFLSLYVQ